MEFNEYQEKVLKYRKESAGEVYAIIGLSGEVGELHSLIAKAIRDGVEDEDAFNQNVKKELGDILWFIAAISKDLEIDMNEIAMTNFLKLQDRFERGTISGSGDSR